MPAELPDTLSVDVRGDVAVVLIDREPKRNAMDTRTLLGLESFFLAPPDGVRAVVLAGRGPHFCAGLDLSDLSATDAEAGMHHSRMWHRVTTTIGQAGLPVVTALAGAVIGGGLEIASATHIRVAEPSAFYALPEGQRGLFLGGGGSVRLSRLIGVPRMTDLMLTGRVYTAAEGHRPASPSTSSARAGRSTRPSSSRTKAAAVAPVTAFAVLQALPRIAEVAERGYLLGVARQPAVASSSDDAQARMQAFLEGRSAEVRVRRPVTAVQGGRPSSAPCRSGRAGGGDRQLPALWLESERGLSFEGYDDLYAWSVDDLDAFWQSIWDYFGVRAHSPHTAVLGDDGHAQCAVVPEAALNYAEHAVGAWRDPQGLALIERSQTRGPRETTRGQLAEQVARARAGLQRLGVGKGDRVVAYLPNITETAIAYLATISLGAVWASCAPEFGHRAIVDRFSQIDPGAPRRARVRLRREGDRPHRRVAEIRRACPRGRARRRRSLRRRRGALTRPRGTS
ncbi:MAG: crotonase/enoyl-CoA hydratase family protein [Candidatus Nanopelagicales bacterium]